MTMYFVAQPSHLQLMSPADRTAEQQQQQHWLEQKRRLRLRTISAPSKTTTSRQTRRIILRTCYLLGALAALTCLLAGAPVSAASDQTTGVTRNRQEESHQQQQQQDITQMTGGTGRAGDPEPELELERLKRRQQQQVSDSNLKPAGAKQTTTTTTGTQPSDVNENNNQHKQQVDEGLRQDQVHKLMSEKDLRRTFHVERHDQVPEYQILKLTVASDGSHLISPISDLGELLLGETGEEQVVVGQGAAAAAIATSQANEQQLKVLSTSRSANQQVEDAATAADATAGQARVKRSPPQVENQDQDKQLLVMSLSTFGRDFSLRLKRNADFQKRIKDMKMFLAESMGDGQLKYTEIKPNHNQQSPAHHHKQEPHKRAAEAEDAATAVDKQPSSHTTTTTTGQGDAKTTAQAAKTTTTTTTTGVPGGEQTAAKGQGGGGKQTADWIGSAYHDEENLAAILVERDQRTGQLRLDGTIGNDFVIKPMPRATIEALVARQQQVAAADSSSSAKKQQAADEESALASLDLERSPSATASTAATPTGGETTPAPSSAPSNKTTGEPVIGAVAAHHLHDDDPHDDDEMFLDEDEALELAHLQASAASVESNHTTTATQNNLPQQQQQQARALSKVASERKWRKYRKMLAAQTQVPKQPQAAARARRHTAGDHQLKVDALTLSHHIVFRQQPSSEASSDEHQHSFMLAPGQQSMEAMARRFPSAGRGKRSATEPEMIDGETGAGGVDGRLSANDLQEADFAHDPMGGQFYLEPASMTGFERAGFADWSLGIGKARMMSPPYVLNSTDDRLLARPVNGTGSEHLIESSTGHPRNATHARYRRHAPRAGPAALPPATQRGRRHKRQAPDVVWPEVLLVVDYDSFLLHGGDSREVKRYFVSFWNGVDLRYKLLVNPHIRISLAGMIVAKDRDATPYLERNRLRAPNADAVDAAGALTDMGKYLYREDRLPTYDLAVVITKLDMCRRRYEGGRCNRGTAGFAYVGGACVVNKRLEKVNSVAIIEDSGGFSGIIVAAHEVGHLLGCVHDGSPPPSYLGGPGATHCPWEDGFIMSDLRHTERGFRWSQCSVEQFKHFLNGETATCLYNYPHESQMLNRLLPGHMLSLDDQCKRDRGTNACFKDARVCAQLFCFDSASGYCVSYRPAAEGSPCGDGHTCRNGKCVSVAEMENIIPDYTHQSQTVVAAAGRGAGRPLVVGGAGLLPPARLADNGLSASSTSTATSSPDNKQATAVVSSSGGSTPQAAAPQQISSRMDTSFSETPPLVEYGQPESQLPLVNYAQPQAYLNRQYHQHPQQQQVNNMKSAKLVQSHQQHRQSQARAAGPGLSQTTATRYAPDNLSHTYHNLQRSSSAGQAGGQSNNMRRYQQSLNYQQPTTTGGGLLTSASSSSPYTRAAAAAPKRTPAGVSFDIEPNSNLFSSRSGGPLAATSTTSGAKLSTTSHTPQPPAIAVNKKRQAHQVQQSSARQLAPLTSTAAAAQRPNYKSSAQAPSGSASRSQPQSLDHNHHHNQKQPSSHNYEYYNRQQQQQQHHLLQSTPVN